MQYPAVLSHPIYRLDRELFIEAKWRFIAGFVTQKAFWGWITHTELLHLKGICERPE